MAVGTRLQAARPPARASVIASAKFRPQSRIGKQPVAIPDGVTVTVDGSTVHVKGPKGELTKQFNRLVNMTVEDRTLTVSRAAETKKSSMMHGTTRAIASNMIKGCAEGYVRELELRGVGYRAAVDGQTLTLALGYNHPVVMQMPTGVTATVTRNTAIKLEGHDNEVLGNIAAQIRGKRPPEPYKGKGVRYLGEFVRQKAGKSG